MQRKVFMLVAVFTLFLSSMVPQASTIAATPIKHVIIIIDENHSFDNMFGAYPFGWPPKINNITLSVMWPEGLYTNYTQLEDSKTGALSYISVPNIPWLPFAGVSHPYYANAYSTADPYEGWSPYHGDYWFGSPTGFVYYSGPQSMAYFSYQQNWIFWDYAEEYTLADNYFSPVLGLTEPNRVAYLTGFPPSFYSDEANQVIPYNDTIFYQLSSHNVSWGYYVYGYQGGIPWPLNAFIGINQAESNFYSLSSFYNDLKNGTLPSVSWLMFIGSTDEQYDIHPPYNVTAGEVELTKVINAVMESASWNSTAIFITFDEGGGYYDQVTPPSINYYGLGQRIPLLIISPYAKEGFIDNYTLSGYTLLGFIDYNWHLPWLTKYVQTSDVQGLLEAFNFSSNPRPPIILEPSNWSYPLPLQYPIHYGYIAEVQNYKSYAQLYSAPAMTFLLPIEVIAFVLIFFRRKLTLIGSLMLFLITLGISAYYYNVDTIYSFITEYYMYPSLIGLLASGALFAKRMNKG